LVAAYNGGRPPSSGFPKYSRHQLTASHFSQRQLKTVALNSFETNLHPTKYFGEKENNSIAADENFRFSKK
jgi:hypothetical protein